MLTFFDENLCLICHFELFILEEEITVLFSCLKDLMKNKGVKRRLNSRIVGWFQQIVDLNTLGKWARNGWRKIRMKKVPQLIPSNMGTVVYVYRSMYVHINIRLNLHGRLDMNLSRHPAVVLIHCVQWPIKSTKE